MFTEAVVNIISRRYLSIDAHCETQPNNHILALHNLSFHFNSSLKRLHISSKMKHLNYKGEYGMTCIKALKRRANFGYISGLGLLAI